MSLMHLGAISKASRSRDLTDHLLVFFGGALALYSIAASLRKEGLAIALVGSYFACSALGFLLARASVGTKWRNWDGGLTALFGFLGFVLSPRINAGLPEGGFPFELLTAAALSFMLIFSSLSGWRDRTLLFQSLPCIALFGLVGTFDTFPFGIWFFFGFLVSNGVLYARVHRRTMIRRAELAGESDPGLLTRGAWKWMAGPEWAFISGFVIVLLSLLGAPVIRSTVQPVTAQVRTNIPNALQQALRQNEDRQNRGITPGTAVENRIGRGPADQDETPRLRVRMSGPGYLRNERFAIYNSSGWNKAAISVSEDNPIGYRRSTAMGNTIPGPNGGVKGWAGGMPPTEELLDFQVERVQYRALSNLGATILAPGPVVEVKVPNREVTFVGSGDVMLDGVTSIGTEVEAWYVRPVGIPDRDTTTTLPEPLNEIYLDASGTPRSVSQLARSLVAPDDSAYEKARKITEGVRSRVRYNLNAPATPQGMDPVENFLFTSREGYCDLFASSVVLMARAVDLPARYQTGWLVTMDDMQDNGEFLVTSSSYHAWAEIYFEGYGWLAFDATEGAEQVPGGERGSRVAQPAFWTQPTFWTIALGVVLAAVAFPLVRRGLQSGWTIGRMQMSPKGDIGRSFAAFHLAIERTTGSPKRFTQTLREYVDAQAPRLGPLAEEADGLVQRFDQALFGPQSVDRELAAQLKRDVGEFRKRLAAYKRDRGRSTPES